MFYALFLVYALSNRSGFLLIDHVNLVIHEGGHLLFGWLGRTLGLWGGTLLELLVPLELACYFVFQRHPTGTTFSSLFFFVRCFGTPWRRPPPSLHLPQPWNCPAEAEAQLASLGLWW